MKRDIDKLADRLVERGREGIVAEKKMLEWKIAEKKEQPASKTKAGSLPTLTIVARPNGSGKTTLTKWVREEFQDNAVLDPDAIANSLQTTGVTKGSAIDAGREVLLKAERLIADSQSLTVETTLSGLAVAGGDEAGDPEEGALGFGVG
jgi:hypothetical protein